MKAINTKGIFIVFVLFIFFILSISFSTPVDSTYIKVNSLGHEKYGVELCYHDGNCTYYQNNETFFLNATKDYIIKIIHEKKDHAWGKSIYNEAINKYMIIIWAVLLGLFLTVVYKAISLK